MRERNYQIDNLKVILIFCVIFGHLLECVGGGYNLYKIIYSFHMPMFLFVNGWLAPRNYVSKKTMFKLIYPYVLFQLLYQLFNTYVINEEYVKFSVQFGTPYWLLWYLLSLIFYYSIIPIIASGSKTYAGVVLLGTIAIAIAIGFDNSIGYYMSLSRTFVFLPCFVFGYYAGHGVFRTSNIVQSIRKRKSVILLSIILAFTVCLIMYKQNLSAGALFGSVPYQQGQLMWYIRMEMLMVSFIWIGIFMVLVPNRKFLGSVDTFPIYVMHGFVVLYLKKYNPFLYALPVNLLIASLISVTLILLFGNKYISQIIKTFFRGEWAIKLWNKIVVERNA
ncbi:MAG: acyltransferase family protein [Lachnospiraceae bacterium]|nr:acyltransferase family protein [Lachnospiraceae bacterium]